MTLMGPVSAFNLMFLDTTGLKSTVSNLKPIETVVCFSRYNKLAREWTQKYAM